MKRAVLFIDVLGVQKMWKSGGAEAVRDRIDEFHRFVSTQLTYLPDSVHRDAEYSVIVSGDSVAIMCQDVQQAAEIGIHLFGQAFYATAGARFPFWLRGAISKWSNQGSPINTTPVFSKGVRVGSAESMEQDYLKVLALEKSGYKGMRLIVEKELSREASATCQASWNDFKRPLPLIASLKGMSYPEGTEYCDVLWMAAHELSYGHFKGIMTERYMTSFRDTDEMVQAGWTRAIFDLVDSFVWSCRTYPNAPPQDGEGDGGVRPTPSTPPLNPSDRSREDPESSQQTPKEGESKVGQQDDESLDILRMAVEKAARDDGWAFLGAVGHALKALSPDFDWKSLGYEKFIHWARTYPTAFEFKEVHDPLGPIHYYLKLKAPVKDGPIVEEE